MPKKMAEILTKEERVTNEDKRLRKIYKNLPEDALNLYDGLIHRAAYMRIALEDYEADLDANGYVEQFSQSDKLEPYERERPVARLYNTMNKNYQSIMKQLADRLPEAPAVDPSEEILQFAIGGKK